MTDYVSLVLLVALLIFLMCKILPIFEWIKDAFIDEVKRTTNLAHLNSLISAIKMSEEEKIKALAEKLGFREFEVHGSFGENDEGSHEYFVTARSLILSLKEHLPVCFLDSDETVAFWEFISSDLLIQSLLNEEVCLKCENCENKECKLRIAFEEGKRKALSLQDPYYDPQQQYEDPTNIG